MDDRNLSKVTDPGSHSAIFTQLLTFFVHCILKRELQECQGRERYFQLAQCFICSLKCAIIPWLELDMSYEMGCFGQMIRYINLVLKHLKTENGGWS